MKIKVIACTAWLAYCAVYIYLIRDIGRAIGYNVKSVVTEDFFTPWNLVIDTLKFDFTTIAILTIILVLLTVICYNIVLNKTKK